MTTSTTATTATTKAINSVSLVKADKAVKEVSTTKADKAEKANNKAVNKNTNKAFTETFKNRAINELESSQEFFALNQESDAEITETSSRSKRLGESGMKLETHSRMNSYLSGLQANEMRVLKLINPDLSVTNLIANASREHKSYLIGLCAIIANEKTNPSLDAINKAAFSVSASFKAITKIHKTVYAMLEALADNDHQFSDTYIKELMQHKGLTQAHYVCGFFKTYGLGTVSKDGTRRVVTINNEHPLIIKARDLVASKKVTTGY